MKYTCDCLNVKLHVKQPTLEPIDEQTRLDLFGSEILDDTFLSGDVSVVQLNIEGIQQEYDCLVSRRTRGNWIVAQCINCTVNTHAVHVQLGVNKVLVSSSLKGGPKYIAQLQSTDSYSPLYKIVVHRRSENSDILTQLVSYASLHDDLNAIQQRLNAFLLREEAGMEDRIRRFSDEEHARYADLQSRSRCEKNTIIKLVMASNSHVVEDNVVDDKGQVPEPSPVNAQSPQTTANVPTAVPTARHNGTVNTANSHNLTVTSSQQKTRRESPLRNGPQPSTSPENDEMFVLDGFDDSYTPDGGSGSYDYESDDEESSDSGMGLSGSSSRDVPVRSVYSSSVPVDVPAWTSRPRSGDVDPLEQEGEVPGDIAASIKALAQSVREDGTEIFGDLPRRSRKFSTEKVRR